MELKKKIMKKYNFVTLSLFAILLVSSQAQTAGFYETPEYYGNWGLEKIGAASAYDLGFTGKGVLVGIRDSGFDIGHSEFQNRITMPFALVTSSLQPGAPFRLEYPEQDSNDLLHGTHVAGIIGAARDGIRMHGVSPSAHMVTDIFIPVLPLSESSPEIPINRLSYDELLHLAQNDPIQFWQPYVKAFNLKSDQIGDFALTHAHLMYDGLKERFPNLKVINESFGDYYSRFKNPSSLHPEDIETLREAAEETLETVFNKNNDDEDNEKIVPSSSPEEGVKAMEPDVEEELTEEDSHLLQETDVEQNDKEIAQIAFPKAALKAVEEEEIDISRGEHISSSFLLDEAKEGTPMLESKYRAVLRNGLTIIKSAGNESLVEPLPESLFTYFHSWAYGTQMVVVATDQEDQLTSYSNWCGHAKSYCLAAPGGTDSWLDIGASILSTTPAGQYETMFGTSMAAPHVAGAWALAQEIFPEASNLELFSLILKTATRHPKDPQHAKGELSDVYGWGHLSVSNLVQAIHPLTSEIYDSTRQATFSTLTPILENLLERGSAWRRVSGAISLHKLPKKSVWAYGLKGWGKEKRLSTQGPFPFTYASHSRVNGIMGGYDFLATEKLRIGLGGAFTETKAGTKSGIGTADVKGGHLLGYVNWTQGSWFIDGVGIASVFGTHTRRYHIPGTENTLLGYKNLHATSKVFTYGFGSEVAAGYTWRTPTGAYVEPYLIGSLMAWNRPDFREKGADIFNLRGDSTLFLNADVGVGARLATPWKTLGALVGQLEGNIAYLRKVSGTTHSYVSLLGRSIYPIGGQTARSKDTLRLGALLTLKSPSPEGRAEVSFAYQGDLQRQNVLHVLSANFTYRF
jgi:subtilisin family serine protease